MTKDRRFNDTHKINMALWVVFMLAVMGAMYLIVYGGWVLMEWLLNG